MIKWDTKGDSLTKKNALCYSFHFMKKYPYKSKNPECTWAKASVIHDHYSFWNLKTIGSLMEVQLFRVCPRGNGGNPASFASWSSTSTMLMLKLPNVSTTSTIIFSSLSYIILGLMKPVERNEKLSGGMSIFALSLSL